MEREDKCKFTLIHPGGVASKFKADTQKETDSWIEYCKQVEISISLELGWRRPASTRISLRVVSCPPGYSPSTHDPIIHKRFKNFERCESWLDKKSISGTLPFRIRHRNICLKATYCRQRRNRSPRFVFPLCLPACIRTAPLKQAEP